jgi:hypothetical protein
MQTPNVLEVMDLCGEAGLSTRKNDTSFFLGRETLLYGSELANASNQLSLRLHAQHRSLYLALENVDLPLLCGQRSLLYPDRSQCLLRVLSLARVRKACVNESCDCERESDYLCPGGGCLESAASARFSEERCGLWALGRCAWRTSSPYPSPR